MACEMHSLGTVSPDTGRSWLRPVMSRVLPPMRQVLPLAIASRSQHCEEDLLGDGLNDLAAVVTHVPREETVRPRGRHTERIDRRPADLVSGRDCADSAGMPPKRLVRHIVELCDRKQRCLLKVVPRGSADACRYRARMDSRRAYPDGLKRREVLDVGDEPRHRRRVCAVDGGAVGAHNEV
eukprot:scaffold11437_cov75-Phaeocystis_antarctica.AAC.1